MDGRRTTIKDIAEYCGVSAGTVHNALNGKKGVSPAMREKIIAAAREHNFRINTVAACRARQLKADFIIRMSGRACASILPK
jgi:DNA-binding LacI/PurR family transcriptional regulator